VDLLLSQEYKRNNSLKYKSKNLLITKTVEGKLLLQIHKSVFYSTNLNFTFKNGDYYCLEVDLLQKIPAKLVQKLSIFSQEFEFSTGIDLKDIKDFQDLCKYDFQKFTVCAGELDRLENVDFQKLETEEILEILQDIKSFIDKQDLEDFAQDTGAEKWVFMRASDIQDRQVMILGNRNGILKFCIE
jgi:hypothetical protein